MKAFFSLGILFLTALHALGQQAEILEVENSVQSAKAGKRSWSRATTGQQLAVKDRVQTLFDSRAMVRVSELYTMRMDEFTTVEITPRLTGSTKPTLNVARGITFIFSREEEGEIDVTTPTANAALKGTQLVVEVSEGGKTTISVIEGRVDLSNEFGAVELMAGEAGEAEKGKAPRKTAVIEARNLVQWALYYPGILDANTLGLDGKGSLAGSLAAYRQGDVLGALERLPKQGGGGVGEKLFRAQVLLAVGRVDDSTRLLQTVPHEDSRRQALERLIEAVTFVPEKQGKGEELRVNLRLGWDSAQAELALAESYYQQARHQLKEARAQARLAIQLAPDHGFAWARLAELEFSFGENGKAENALNQALKLTPRNPQAHALQGFIFAGRNKLELAEASFETALSIDGALGNAWLGRGLVKIRRGNLEEGRKDLQSAATVEPTRAIFHSYLGKAFGEEGERKLSGKDFALASRLDPLDPTPWLYSAIGHQKRNQLNRAIDDLSQSVRLNDNRRVYRSQLLLDQDRAVRSANLATMYQNAGMDLVAVREATRAVEADYTSASAHLFLANSFDALRDPRRVSLRYETPWFNELLLANLFSPVGGGPLSQFVSQQEYSKMFHADGLGASVQGEWRSDEEMFTTASAFGSHRNFEFGIDVNYRQADGNRVNNQSDLLEIYAQAKWQATPDDIVYFLGKWQEQSSGDNFQTFDNRPLEPLVDFDENQRPGLLMAGWNHRWKPGVHTLFLGGRLSAEQTLTNPQSEQLKVVRSPSQLVPGFVDLVGGSLQFTDPALNAEVQNAIASGGPVPGQIGTDGTSLHLSPTLLNAVEPFLGSGSISGISSTGAPGDLSSFDLVTQREFEIYSADLQQVFQTERSTLLIGGRAQGGEIRARSQLVYNRPVGDLDGFGNPASTEEYSYDFMRFNAYAYDYWKVLDSLTLLGGVSWDWIQSPENFRNPPLSPDTQIDQRLSGKAGFTYSPSSWITARGMFSEGLGGVTFDESVRLEPVQIAGFNQSFRTALSESIAGSVETPEFTTWGFSLEGTLPTRTWWGVSASGISQDVERERGIFTGYTIPVLFDLLPVFFPDTTRELLEYEELQLSATLNQLMGDEWALGARYRLTRSELSSSLPDLGLSSSEEALLHEVSLFADWNSPTGLFARVQGDWYAQSLDGVNDSSGAARESDPFFQFNASLGYRFADNQGEVSLSALNLFDQDYELYPLSPYLELPRERTFVVRCRWNF
ncbi:MAG: TonB-dependent receptor domain-containing protein [Roseibacillus sp.]